MLAAPSPASGLSLTALPVRRYRVLSVAAHPVQYASANFRELAPHPRFHLKVAYCSFRGAEAGLDPEFGVEVQWDVPLLDGYDWVRVPNRGNGSESFWGLGNPGLWNLVRSESFDALICLTGYRPTSVFVSNGRFAFFLVPVWLFAFGYGGYLILRTRKGRILTLLSLGAITLAIAMASSRGTLLWTAGSAVVCVVAFLWGCPWQRGQLVRILRSFQRALLIGLIFTGIATYLYPTEVTNRFTFYWETLSPTSPSSELLARTSTYPIQNFLYAFESPQWPYGYGIGTSSLGRQYVARIFHVPYTGFNVESGYGTLVVELGIVGLFLWIVMASAIVISAWKAVRKLKGTVWFPIGFVTFWYAALLLFPYTFMGLSPFEDFILNSLLWISLGILFRLPSLAVNVQASSSAAASAPDARMT